MWHAKRWDERDPSKWHVKHRFQHHIYIYNTVQLFRSLFLRGMRNACMYHKIIKRQAKDVILLIRRCRDIFWVSGGQMYATILFFIYLFFFTLAHFNQNLNLINVIRHRKVRCIWISNDSFLLFGFQCLTVEWNCKSCEGLPPYANI